MAKPPEKLADSLAVLKTLQDQGVVAIRSADLSRTHRERLVRNGFLHEVMKGWYIPARHDQGAGESSTAWYASYWDFCAAYLNHRFGDEWCISPEQSISLHVGNMAVPQQLLVHTPHGGNKPTTLPHGTSVFDVRYTLPERRHVAVRDGLRVFSLPAALVASGPSFFRQDPTDARAGLVAVRDASDVLAILLEGGHTTIAGRLAGAYRNVGRNGIADQILDAMRRAGYDVRESDPFTDIPELALSPREPSPAVNRLRILWQKMRASIPEHFPTPPGPAGDIDAYLEGIEEIYVTDAYHSLSIEGYRVSPELIERVRSGAWNPDANEEDGERRDALAARGYYEAFQLVTDSVARVLRGEDAGAVAEKDHGQWYAALWGPGVEAGVVAPADLAGYRNEPVYIRRSMHVPPSRESVRELMPVFFELLRAEEDPAVRAVLGHFIFVYIHPYSDGNGRMGRFMMNLMMAGGGYPWTVIPVERRLEYMDALETASTQGDIVPFTEFLGRLVQGRIADVRSTVT